MSLQFTLLGCGNSSGVPSVGNYWGNCDPNEPKNRRSRCCAAVQTDDTTLIIDTGADFRQQTNDFDINMVDAVFYTHQHGDHSHGIDDLRPFYFRNGRKPIKCFGSQFVLDEIKQRFDYLFDGGINEGVYPAVLEARPFEEMNYCQPQKVGSIEYTPFEMDHGTCVSVGYRFGDLSYCVDMKSLSRRSLDVIKGSKIWIVDGAGYKNPDNFVHADLKTLYKYNQHIQAEKVYVTCLSSMMDYKTLMSELPEGFYPAYDGLEFDL